MNHPSRRKSALAGQSPITPASLETLAPPAFPVMSNPEKKTAKQKITISIDDSIANRARGAYLAQLPLRGPQTFSKWIEQAIANHIHTVEKSLNEGATFGALEPGQIPTGRPVTLDKR